MRSVRVLVVDDDPNIRELIRIKLTAAGHHVTTAADGEEGLAIALDERPQLVVLDVMMPKMTGLEVCRCLRADTTMVDVPIVLITAKADEADVQKGFEMGADEYITKPFSPRDLLARLENVLHRAASVE